MTVLRERYRLCPNCGNFCHFDEEQKFCIRCGTKMIEECLQCLEPVIYPTAKFCPACGEVLVAGDDTTDARGDSDSRRAL
jgi:hypothetical protein